MTPFIIGLPDFGGLPLGEIHFTNPVFVSLPVLASAAGGLLLIWLCSALLRKSALRLYGNAEIVSQHTKQFTLLSELPRMLTWQVVLLLLLTAAAGPFTANGGRSEVAAERVKVVAALDASYSFAPRDYAASMPRSASVPSYGSRLDFAKLVLNRDVIPEIPGNRLGVLTYCAEAVPAISLTRDYEAVRWAMLSQHYVHIASAPGAGSNYADGMLYAVHMFEQDKLLDKGEGKKLQQAEVLLLFSDGGLDAEPEQLAASIKAVNGRRLKVFVIGIGTDKAQPIPLYQSDTGAFANYLDDGKTTTKFNDANLRKLTASLRGARYIRLLPGQRLRLPWSELVGQGSVEQRFDQPQSLVRYPGGAAFAMIVALLCRFRRRRDINKPELIGLS